MSALASQMQAKMNQHLAVKRVDTMIKNAERKMLACADRIEKRPSVGGCDALEKVQSHSLVIRSKDSAGSMILGAAMGIPGLSDTAEAVVDAGEQLYSDSKMANTRHQDHEEYSDSAIAEIKADNQSDLKAFYQAEQLAMQLYAFKSCGVDHVKIDDINNEIYPWDEIASPQYNKKLTPEEIAELEKAVQFTNTPAPPMRMGA